MRQCHVDVERIGDAAVERAHAAAYLELHIEQGPVLERLGLPLGVVLGTKGVERHAITFHGQEAHSGSTPMAVRRDALAAAAKLALEIRPIARKHPDAVATMGSVKTFPGIVTAVVGRCETTLDMRDLDAGVLAAMLAEAQEASRRFAAEEGCTVEWSRIWSIEPIPFDPRLIELCDQAVRETAGTSHRLPSGPLHDAAEVARAGIPVVMMFTQSLAGLSHNPAENTKVEHLELAVQAFDRLARKTISKLSPASGTDFLAVPYRARQLETLLGWMEAILTIGYGIVHNGGFPTNDAGRGYRPNERPNFFCPAGAGASGNLCALR